jgi:exodeoxyribonuclease V alpha subunit
MTDDTRIDAIAARALQQLQAEGALRQVDLAFAELLRDRLRASMPVALAGALAMRAVAMGHSSFALAEADRLLEALGVSAQLPQTEAWADTLRASDRVATAEDDRDRGRDDALLAFEDGRIALLRYARYEQDLAERLYRRAHASAQADAAAVDTPLGGIVQRLFPNMFTGMAPGDAHDGIDRQALAALMALRRRLLLITGGPGTGKTTTVARLLAMQVAAAQAHGRAPPRIALAAPTGRAAARLGEAIDGVLRADLDAGRLDAVHADAIPRQARTLHRLLGWQPGRVGFRHDAQRPLPFDLVVVDEASMVDLPLMAKLVAAVPADATLVLLGDPDQLPAVEAGDVLGGLCAACGDGLALPAVEAGIMRAVSAMPVPSNDASAPLMGARVHLLHAWRQADARMLQALAQAIQRDDRDAVRAYLRSDDPALTWRHGDANALIETMRREALPAFQAVCDADDPQQALRLGAQLRVLTALRRGPFGAEHWNAWCAAELGARTPYFNGRLLMIAANSERHGLYNGDVGVVWDDPRGGETAVWFDTAQGLRAWRPAQLPVHGSAYVTTVHKAQGSEFERIVLMLPDADARVLSRELLYTALTRARLRATLWATPETLERALERRTWRDSGLEARLRALSPASAAQSFT